MRAPPAKLGSRTEVRAAARFGFAAPGRLVATKARPAAELVYGGERLHRDRSVQMVRAMRDLRALYRRWHSPVLAMTKRMLPDGTEAEEAAQDVFIEAWRREREYDEARGSEWAWLRTIARTRCLDRLRSSRRKAQRAYLVVTEAEMTEEAPHGEIRALLDRLPDAQRLPIELAFVAGFTHREISARIGLPLGTVKTRIRLGLGRLVAQLSLPRIGDQAADRQRCAAGGVEARSATRRIK